MPKAPHHHVYVIELDDAVLKDKVFVTANPARHPELSCLYVGMTGLTPTKRFKNHQAGHKSNKYVRKFGKQLLPSLYEYYNPMTYPRALAKEKELAEELRAQGYAVWQH
jgi:predicted GIY-YIG superfamily endonuclease